jgi:vacuolar-type H+-ATPase subunit H
MNYFNYFTEIEEEFVKRRGRHMLVSPLDWALIENWKQRGIPLYIVLRGIESSFAGYDRRAHRGRRVNSLFFCRQTVEAIFEEYRESRVGGNGDRNGDAAKKRENGHGESHSPFTPVAVIAYLSENCEALERLLEQHASDAVLSDTFGRTTERLRQIIEDLQESVAFVTETLETDLTMIEEVILDGLKEHAGEERLEQIRKAGKKRLRAYKQTMERDVYQQTLENFLAQRLREEYLVPRLSLFYL